MPPQRVLVVDDERLVRWSLGQRLTARGWNVTEAASAAEAVNAPAPDAAILDYKLPDGDGIEVLRRLRHVDPDLPVIMLTAHQDTELIVEAIKAGASDYLTKPFEVDEVVLRMTRAVEAARGSRELRRLKEDLARPFSLDSVIGESDVMQRLKTLARKMAESPTSTVLLTGESGTGKDLLAKVIHFGGSRAARPFMNITCSALPETLLESELFGHERGAFTDARQQKRGLFEQADEGTVFLDEVAETVPTFQAKLLRFLEEKTFRRLGGTADITVNVRIIAATNQNLEKTIREGKFREDLYYRLNVLRLEAPPLRARGRDIVLLAEHYIRVFSQEFRRPVRHLSPAAEQALLAYSWPGNVRELRNLVERAVVLAESECLEPVDFESMHTLHRADGEAGGGDITLPEHGLNLEDVERRLVTLALDRTRGNQTRAAALLGLHRDQIRYRIEKFGLKPDERP
ncbi:MAG TPA: sigma-54 dependent transcriptional regulator [Vicinamibacterales bacterium]|nr:sigma-54 dependent transcriptional regulator [Vicinamibacterales bacterium]